MSSQQQEVHRTEHEQKYCELLEILDNSAVEQEKILARILSVNAETEYLRNYHLDGATDAKSFKKKVPVSDYDDYKPFVDKAFEGDKSPLLTAYPVTQFWTSSGTSKGTPKMFLGTDEEIMHRASLMNYNSPIVSRALPEVTKSKCLSFVAFRKSAMSPGGLPYHPIGTVPFSSRAFTQIYRGHNKPTSPLEVIASQDYNAGIYCHLLLGLVQREEVGRIRTSFPTTLMKAMRCLGEWWPEICDDIANGHLSTTRVQEEELRSAVLARVEKLPDLAERLKNVFSTSKSWKGIVPKLWPNVKVVDCCCTATMKPYFHAIKEYAGDVPVIASGMYVSTEASHGFNLDMKRPADEACYNLFPGSAYYEFIPVEETGPHPEVLDLVQVREGQEYEILVTTLSGLYRYRIGEILKVVGYYKSSPTFQIVRRSNVVLSVDMDKTDEIELRGAVNQGSQVLQRELGWRLVDYTSTVDYASRPGHYVIFWELDDASTSSLLSVKDSTSTTSTQQVLEDCCAAMEGALGRIYRRGRHEDVVGALELRLVREGTFDRLCNDAISRGTSADQFKIPRGLAPASSGLQVMVSNAIRSVFSKQKPPM